MDRNAASPSDIDWVVRYVLHAIDVGGEDCVGLGGDLDGNVTVPLEIGGISDYSKISDLLLHAGLTTSQVEKICYPNFERVFCKV